MYSYAKLLIFSEINNYFDVFLKKKWKKIWLFENFAVSLLY
jgi:hypothetical protein